MDGEDFARKVSSIVPILVAFVGFNGSFSL